MQQKEAFLRAGVRQVQQRHDSARIPNTSAGQHIVPLTVRSRSGGSLNGARQKDASPERLSHEGRVDYRRVGPQD